MKLADSSLNMAQDGSGVTTVTIAPTGGYSGTVALSCEGLPENAVCIFAQSSIKVAGDNYPVSVELTIQTAVAAVRMPAIRRPGQRPMSPVLPALAFWFPGGMAGLAAFGRKRRLSKTGQRWPRGFRILERRSRGQAARV